ncbi:MAG: hypothetical protein ABR981_05700 [Candidatus Micrarchaeaceae archaeon]
MKKERIKSNIKRFGNYGLVCIVATIIGFALTWITPVKLLFIPCMFVAGGGIGAILCSEIIKELRWND